MLFEVAPTPLLFATVPSGSPLRRGVRGIASCVIVARARCPHSRTYLQVKRLQIGFIIWRVLLLGALTADERKLRDGLRRQLGDAISAKDLTTRTGELTRHNQQLVGQASQAAADGQALRALDENRPSAASGA